MELVYHMTWRYAGYNVIHSHGCLQSADGLFHEVLHPMQVRDLLPITQVITPTPGCIVSEKIQHESTSPAVCRDTHTCLV